MSYVKTKRVNDETRVSEAKMNNIEQGISSIETTNTENAALLATLKELQTTLTGMVESNTEMIAKIENVVKAVDDATAAAANLTGVSYVRNY